jgi:hypothetical protein
MTSKFNILTGQGDEEESFEDKLSSDDNYLLKFGPMKPHSWDHSDPFKMKQIHISRERDNSLSNKETIFIVKGKKKLLKRLYK